jgi:methyl-accepting chemotaxis protein
LKAAEVEAKQDDLDSLIQQTLDQQEESAKLSERLAKTVSNTENIAVASTNKLNAQGEQLNSINRKLDDLSHTVDVANKNANYLRTLNGSIFTTFAAKGPADSKQVMNLQFADAAPKDSTGRPIPTPRITSLTLGNMKRAKRPTESTEDVAIELDTSATIEQKERSKLAEKTIEKNLNYVKQGVSNLKEAALSLGTELDRQTHVVSRIHEKTDNNSIKIGQLNSKIHGRLYIMQVC